MQVQTSAHCMVCERQTLHQKPRINNTLHLILSLLTVGLWAMVWLTLGVINASRRPMCVSCGGKVTGRQVLNEAGFNLTPTKQRATFEPPAAAEPQQFAPPSLPSSSS